MPTLYPHRLLILAHVAAVPAVVAWLRANIDTNSVPNDLGPGLNLSGKNTDAITHHWCCGAFTEQQTKQNFARLCQIAGVTPPKGSDWDAATKGQKRTIVNALRAGIKAGGIGVMLMDNEGQWDDPTALLAEMGVKVRGETK